MNQAEHGVSHVVFLKLPQIQQILSTTLGLQKKLLAFKNKSFPKLYANDFSHKGVPKMQLPSFLSSGNNETQRFFPNLLFYADIEGLFFYRKKQVGKPNYCLNLTTFCSFFYRKNLAFLFFLVTPRKKTDKVREGILLIQKYVNGTRKAQKIVNKKFLVKGRLQKKKNSIRSQVLIRSFIKCITSIC